MKKIALLTDGWKRYLMYSWVDGIMGYARNRGEDICLYHYNCYGNWSHDSGYNQGEYNIFNLPDLSHFDGIVLDCNNILEEAQRRHLIELLKELQKQQKVPVVSINYDVDEFYYVGVNNEKPIREMMEHLYEVHGCRSFLFAGGPKDNHENEIRVATYLKSLEEYGLSPEDNPVWYRDYDFDTGIYYMQQLIEQGEMFPDAIVCANDNIATGLCTEAERKGYRVPDDFRVTGFDNLDKAMYFQPQITTVEHHRGEIGYKCIDILCRVWRGEKLEKYHLIDTSGIFSESCGCPNSRTVDYRAYMKNQVTYNVDKEKEDVKLVDLEADMSMCGSFTEIFRLVGDFLRNYDCDGLFVVVDKDLLDVSADTVFSVEGYKRSNLKLVYANDFTNEDCRIYSVDELQVYMEENGRDCHFLHTPIHFGKRTVGYTVMKNGRFLYDKSLSFYSMHSVLTREMENLYRRRQIENVNRELRDVYNKDQLTGLFNRIAYNERLEPDFEEYYRSDVVCSILFVDVNDFKKINDTYGHKYGDEVLKKVAELIQRHCTRDGYCYRYGGDEFVMFLPHMDRDGAEMLKADMKTAAKDINIGISIGIAVTNTEADMSLQAYVEIADKNMYNDKMKK